MRWIILGLGIALIFFILGWLFPVEGPLDYLYDDYAKQPAHKHPYRAAPIQKKIEVINFDEDIIEWYPIPIGE